jgi:hypothetical protein
MIMITVNDEEAAGAARILPQETPHKLHAM